MKLVSFNIDVDPIDCYFDIHGLKNEKTVCDPVFTKGVIRFLELFEKHDIKATFFITASDLNEKSREILRKIVDNGHEIGNHSYSHDYCFTLLDKGLISKEITKNHEAIKDICGYECTGFRSPGYNTSDDVLNYLKEEGYSYDSSFFPSPVYYFAKWLIIKLKKLRGRVSKSIVSSLKDCYGSKKPYRVGKNIRQNDNTSKLIELPITTVTPFGLPLIGTSAIVFPEFIYNFMLKLSLRSDYINFEAHGIDLCDVQDDEKLFQLRDFQPDLKHTLDRKFERFEKLIEHYGSKGYKFKTLRDISDIYNRGEMN